MKPLPITTETIAAHIGTWYPDYLDDPRRPDVQIMAFDQAAPLILTAVERMRKPHRLPTLRAPLADVRGLRPDLSPTSIHAALAARHPRWNRAQQRHAVQLILDLGWTMVDQMITAVWDMPT